MNSNKTYCSSSENKYPDIKADSEWFLNHGFEEDNSVCDKTVFSRKYGNVELVFVASKSSFGQRFDYGEAFVNNKCVYKAMPELLTTGRDLFVDVVFNLRICADALTPAVESMLEELKDD